MPKSDYQRQRLRECPFCGIADAARVMTRHGKDGWPDRHFVICDISDGGCGAQTGWYPNKEEAAHFWNRRDGNDGADRR